MGYNTADTEGSADRSLLPEMQKRFPGDRQTNTSEADYVWLPLRFIGPCAEYPDGMARIDWRDEWSLDEFDG